MKHTPSLLELLRSLTVAQTWSAAVTVVSVLTGAFLLGGLVQSVRDDSKITEISAENRTLKSGIETLSSALKTAQDAQELLKGKAEFQNRYLTYLIAPSSAVSDKLFVDFVCGLWKQSQKHRIQTERRRLEFTIADLQQGLSPDMRELLLKHGVSPQILDRIQAGLIGQQQIPSLERDLNNINKTLNGIVVVKTVTFFDGTKYTVPDEIALAVHMKAECAPN
jgi:outer membrane murein-binding lipoprotein Lpp